MLPAAVGVAISPIPIIAVVLMLVSERGRVNGPAYLLGQIAGVATAGAVALLIAGSVGGSDDGQPATWTNWAKLLLGLALTRYAMKEWRGRPLDGEEAPTPKWMGRIDGFTPPKAFGAGFVLSALNPKNLILTIAGMAAVASVGLPADEQAVVLDRLHRDRVSRCRDSRRDRVHPR